jgi:hypothetical protein
MFWSLCIFVWSCIIMFSLYITVHHLRECVVNWGKWRPVCEVVVLCLDKVLTLYEIEVWVHTMWSEKYAYCVSLFEIQRPKAVLSFGSFGVFSSHSRCVHNLIDYNSYFEFDCLVFGVDLVVIWSASYSHSLFLFQCSIHKASSTGELKCSHWFHNIIN